jgi:hypothetical protein
MQKDIHSRLDQLLHQEVTRKKFILILGTGLVSLTGIPAFLGVLTQQANPHPAEGFGSGDFGGNYVKHVRKIEVK